MINLFGVKGYGEAEFTFSIIKVIAVIGFMYVSFSAPLSLLHLALFLLQFAHESN